MLLQDANYITKQRLVAFDILTHTGVSLIIVGLIRKIKLF